MLRKQPHIVLPHVHALLSKSETAASNAAAGRRKSKASSTNTTTGQVVADNDRKKSLAAERVIEEYRTSSSSALTFCRGYDKMSSLYIQLALYKHKDNKDTRTKTVKMASIPGWTKMTREIKDEGVAIVTAHSDQLLCSNVSNDEGEDEDWRQSERHRQVSFFQSFNTHFEQIFSGNSLPKLVTCYDDSGAEYHQVVKAGDDLRQDAVMQQFFRVVNALLRKDVNVSKRSLQIRTYRVVPLTGTVGVMEFVGNTQALMGVLKNGHKKFHPHEPSYEKLRGRLKITSTITNKKRLKNYEQVCRDVKPCMHSILISKLLEPKKWYEGRLNYTHSAAVTSMTGYIVGLGDRHLGNILLDSATSELVRFF